MSLPIIEQIAENIEATINGITVGNGFNQTLKAIRPRRTDFSNASWGDLDILIDQVESEKLTEEMGYVRWRQYFALTCIIIDSDSETNPIDTRLNQVFGDIAKKLAEDINRDELADDTVVNSLVPFVEEDTSLSGIVIQISVDYRTKENDPYSL